MQSAGKVRQSDKLFRSDLIKQSTDHSAVGICRNKPVSLLSTPVCLHNVAIKTREVALQSNKLFYNVCTQTHTHVCQPLSNLK